MKALPRGPIIRLSAPLNDKSAVVKSTSVFTRDDWAAGRDVSSEEQRCGFLARLREVSQKNTERVNSLPPLEAVIKGQTTDFQVNEINTNMTAAFLSKKPKGRWRKISRKKTILVENRTEPFSNPEKSFSPRVQNFGEYIRLLGKLPTEEPLLQFVMYRDGGTIASVLNRFQYQIGVQKDAVHLHKPPGGSYGCFSQFGTCVGVTKEQLAHVSRHYNIHPLIMDPGSYYPLDQWDLLTRLPTAYFYRILLRYVCGREEDIVQSLRQLKEVGFINYFGLEHFGLSANTLFDLASFAYRGDIHRAVGFYLQSLAETNPFHHSHFMSYVNAEPGSAAGAAEQWALECRGMKVERNIQRLIESVRAYHSSGEKLQHLHEAWKALNMEEAAQRSAAEFVWNAMASQRLLSHGTTVVVGDVVRVSPNEVRLVRTQDEAQSFSIHDIVLPVPYAESDLSQACFPQIGPLTASLFKEFAQQHHFPFLTSALNHDSVVKLSQLPVSYRYVVRKPMQLQVAVLFDPSSFSALKSDLFVMQERKAVDCLSLDFSNRVREPTLYNISERFADRLSLVKKRSTGEQSVALSFILPADASPLAALRECFTLKYLHYSDLYFTK